MSFIDGPTTSNNVFRRHWNLLIGGAAAPVPPPVIGNFVAVGNAIDGGTFLPVQAKYSSDFGVSWTMPPDLSGTGRTFLAAWDNLLGSVAAIGSSFSGISIDGGINWTVSEGTGQGAFSYSCIGYDGSLWAACAPAVIRTSADALNWTNQTAPATIGTLRGIFYTGSLWIVGGNAGACMATSPDAATWTTPGASPFPQIGGGATGVSINTFCSFNGKLYAAGTENSIALANYNVIWESSDNGASWTAVFTRPNSASGDAIIDIASIDGVGIVALGSLGTRRAYFSSDGAAWTSISLPGPHIGYGSMVGVAGKGSNWVIVTAQGFSYTSPDGTTWTNNPIEYGSGAWAGVV